MLKKKEAKKDSDFEKAFISEIGLEEEMKNERTRELWQKYGPFIVLFVVVAVSLTVGFETFKAWQDKRNQEFSNTYAYAQNLQNQGRYAEALDVLNGLVKADKGIYANVAEVQTANVLLEQGKNKEALTILENIVKDDDFNHQMKEVATIKLASYKLENAPAEEIKSLLAPLTVEGNIWSNIAKEMLAMLAVREHDLDTAKNLYQEISDNAQNSEALKARAQDMLNVLEQEKSKK